MPNKRSRRRGRLGNKSSRGAGVNPSDGTITRVPFHSLNTQTLSGVTGNSTFSVSPQNAVFFGLSEIADQFDLFKVVKLEYRIHPMDPTDTVNQVLAFVPDVDIQTLTSAQAAQSPIAAVQTPFSGVPSSWTKVPATQLKGMLDWYKCTADAGAAEFESQGLMLAVGGLSDVINFEIKGLMLLKNPVSAALLMERLIQKAVNSGKVVRVTPTPLPNAAPGLSLDDPGPITSLACQCKPGVRSKRTS